MRLPPLNSLRAFEAAARHGGFVGAAEELCVSRGAVSRHVKLLEEHLGVELFRRLPSGLELTERGRKFLPALSVAFADILQSARNISQEEPSLSVVCPPAMSIGWLIPKLDQFRERHPEYRIRLTTSLMPWSEFETGDFDLIFCNESFETRPAGTEMLRMFPMVITPACSPELLDGPTVLSEPKDLTNFILLHESPDRHDWMSWLEAFSIKDVDPFSGDVFPNLDIAVKAAVLGKGVVVADLILNADEFEAGRLVAPFAGLVCETDWKHFCLLGPANTWNDPKVRAFKSWVAEAAAIDAKKFLDSPYYS